jgi:hypothetical protein
MTKSDERSIPPDRLAVFDRRRPLTRGVPVGGTNGVRVVE